MCDRCTAAGSKPDWKFEDFFGLDHAQDVSLGRQLADHLGIAYDAVNKGPGSSFAQAVDRIQPWHPLWVKPLVEKYHADPKGTKPETYKSFSTVVSGSDSM